MLLQFNELSCKSKNDDDGDCDDDDDDKCTNYNTNK